ncbi:D-alanine--D-alanine ligase [Sporomusa silvacetica DSM 10669]|uniref:D-alanine--D-alanine ligase n=1 Tax=Sporomusa silvacetica DSM 10669 TaxID=1123289 RepID=A0ABZ3IN27_9FIRM|nr:ATP-grasp domain-containing protein [Sporomusa silvacetica]OZC18057.1 D-alanine--D-alanine ligase [Sporomusa silvacetica DSM 10669]
MSNKTVLILRDKIPVNAAEDLLDNEAESFFIAAALKKLGFRVEVRVFDLYEIQALIIDLMRLNPLFVVNLVETVDGSTAMSFLPCSLLDNLHIKYTGSDSWAMVTTINKTLTKKMLSSIGVRTPEWLEISGSGSFIPGERYILKPVNEDGSLYIDNSSLVRSESAEELQTLLSRKSAEWGGECFAERFIAGREFNISILGHKGEPVVLPVAEMLYSGYEKMHLPEILTYDAKWCKGSFEYENSRRSFTLYPKDQELIGQMSEIARKCWKHYRLKGYARIDFRVDKQSIPWLIEINTNPCIADDSGFVASAQKAGLSIEELVRKIILEADSELYIPQ